MSKINSKENPDIKPEWNKFLRNHSELKFQNKPLYQVFLKKNWHNGGKLLQYSINWTLLEKKLEEDSKDIISELKKNPNIGLGILYDRLAYNYFRMRRAGTVYINEELKRTKFRMQNSRDGFILKNEINYISELCKKIEERYPTDSLFEISNRLQYYAEAVDFSGLYFTLRELLDKLFPIIFIFAMAKYKKILDGKVIVSLYHFYVNYMVREYWRNKGCKPKKVSIDKKNTFLKVSDDFLATIKTYSILNTGGSWNPSNIDKALNNQKFKLPLIDINSKAYSVVLKQLGINSNNNIKRLYEVCSSSVHNTLSLPLPSILELKTAKNFVQWYIKEIEILIQNLNIKLSPKTINSLQTQMNQSKSLSELVSFYYRNENKINRTISRVMHQSELYVYDLMKSLFDAIGCGVTRLKNEINYSYISGSINQIRTFSYNTGLELMEENFEKVGNEISNKFKSIGEREILQNFTPKEIGFVCLYLYPEFSHSNKNNLKVSA
ncbi:MAG: hypothetical protein QW413_06575 [Nitrososphaerota archaeon]